MDGWLERAPFFRGIPLMHVAIGVAAGALAKGSTGSEREAFMDRCREALGALDTLAQDRFVTAALTMVIKGAMGDYQSAYEDLDLALDERWGALIFLREEPVFNALDVEPFREEFAKRVAVMGLPERPSDKTH